MNIFTSLSHKTKTSLVASVLILSVLAGTLSACTIPVFTPTPIGEAGAELTPAQETPASPEATLAAPIEVATEMPTLTMTPEPTITHTSEPTLTPTQEITFDIPDAPPNVDPAIWKEAYLSALQSTPYLKLKIEAGLVKPYWDQSMNTFIWDLGGEKFGYNPEFKFTGDVVKDMYGNDWIVRKKLLSGQVDNNTIWKFDKLHLAGEPNLVLGVQCVKFNPGIEVNYCAFVGQVVGRESVNMKAYLTDDFYDANEFEAGIFYGEKNLNFELLVVRFPNSTGTVDLKFPVCISEKCDEPAISETRGTTENIFTGKEVFDSVKKGSMVYINITSINSNDITFLFGGDYIKFRNSEVTGQSIHEAFGWGEHLVSTVNEYFNINMLGKPLSEPFVVAPIFDSDKLLIDKIAPVPASIKIK